MVRRGTGSSKPRRPTAHPSAPAKEPPAGDQPEPHGVISTVLYQPQECAGIVARIRKAGEWQPAKVWIEDERASREAVQLDTRRALLLTGAMAREIEENFEHLVRSKIRGLLRKRWGIDLGRCDATQLVRYAPGGHYLVHQDADDLEYANRYFTIVCYLNSDFQGGGTDFPSLPYTVQPQPGKAIIFPSQYAHAALPVTHGEKFILLTWLAGPVPVNWF